MTFLTKSVTIQNNCHYTIWNIFQEGMLRKINLYSNKIHYKSPLINIQKRRKKLIFLSLVHLREMMIIDMLRILIVISLTSILRKIRDKNIKVNKTIRIQIIFNRMINRKSNLFSRKLKGKNPSLNQKNHQRVKKKI